MYYPYLRGKQNELITIRETAREMASVGFVPLIEPVKESLGGLSRSLGAVVDAHGKAVVIVNPFHGEFSDGGGQLSRLLKTHFCENVGVSAGMLLTGEMTIDDVVDFCESHASHSLCLIHAGFTDAKGLSNGLGERLSAIRHVFIESYCGKLYQKHFKSAQARILVRDGFQRRKNRDHPIVESFSDLHVTFEEEGATGFGDFLIVGDEFSESGGPAYAVAIHLTFIDRDRDDAMFIHHFVSDRQHTPQDPAGKFIEALDKLVTEINSPETKVLESSAVKEFRALYADRHYPGLGYVKKLSMQHHIETLADYFRR